MAFSYNEVGPVNPGFTTVTLTFPFLDRVHVSVSVDKIVLADTEWAWNSDSQIELNEPLVGGEVVKAFRTTPAAGVQADFQPGAFDYEELNTSLLHLLYIVQEAYDNSSVAVEAGNNAFSYLMQIEDLMDDAEVLFGDMQGLYQGYSELSDTALANLSSARSTALSDLATSANSALTALSLARGNALSDIATALTAATGAIATDRAGALSAISTDRGAALTAVAGALSSALTDITAARNSAVTAVGNLVTQAQGFRDTAEGHKNAAATSATNAATSEANAAASVVGAIKDNVDQNAQAKSAAFKINILKNTLQAWEVVGGVVNLSGTTQVDWPNLGVFASLRLRYFGTPSVAGGVWVRFSADNGASFFATSGQYQTSWLTRSGASVGGVATTPAALISINQQAHDVNLLRGNLDIDSFNKPGYQARFTGEAFYLAAGADRNDRVAGWSQPNLNALRLLLSGGSWTTGYAVLEGLRG